MTSPGQRLRELIEAPEILVSFDETNDLMGRPQLRELEERHLPAADRERKYGKGRR